MVASEAELNLPGNLKTVDLTSQLSKLDVPVLMTCGADDLCTPAYTMAVWICQGSPVPYHTGKRPYDSRGQAALNCACDADRYHLNDHFYLLVTVDKELSRGCGQTVLLINQSQIGIPKNTFSL